MELGLVADCLAEVSLPEVVRWAAGAGFKALEVSCVARGNGWFDGAHLVPAKVNDAAARQIDELLAANGLRLSCLSLRENLLDPDEAARNARWAQLADVVRTAARLKVPVVSCLVGRDPKLRAGESIAAWARLAAEPLRLVEEHGLKLAIENGPEVGRLGEDLPANLAFAPEMWEKIFTHAKSDAVGLNLDPSHLVWLGVDPLEVVTAYAERIFHVQAKDTEVFRDRLSDCSVLRPGGGWWRYRLPGLGEIDWRRFIDRLQENGYDGVLAIEHEDPVWTGEQDRLKRSLEFSRRYLAQFIV